MLAKRGVPRVFGAGRPTRPGADEPAIADTRGGLIFGGEPRTRCAAEDGSVRLNLWLPERLLRRRLEVLLDGQNVESVAFQPVFDQTRGAGATIRRMLDFLFVELEHSNSLLTNEMAIRSFEENLALCLLLGLPHNHTQRLLRQNTAAAPMAVSSAGKCGSGRNRRLSRLNIVYGP